MFKVLFQVDSKLIDDELAHDSEALDNDGIASHHLFHLGHRVGECCLYVVVAVFSTIVEIVVSTVLPVAQRAGSIIVGHVVVVTEAALLAWIAILIVIVSHVAEEFRERGAVVTVAGTVISSNRSQRLNS